MDKKLCLLVGLFLLVTKVFAITVHWDGEGGDGLWTTAINWSSNLVPNEDDDIVIDNSIVTSSYTIRLPDIAVTVRSLSMLPDAAFSITLLLPSTNTITSAAFATTGSGYTIVIGSGATFINNGLVSSGTNLVIGDSMQVRNGGRYVHRTRSGHSTWLSRLSKMPITANGTIEFDVPVSSYVISLSGRSYGNLVLSSQLHGVPVTYSGNGSQNVFIRGRLELTAATTLTLSFSGGEFLVENDLVIAPNSTFNVQASSNSNIVRLKGNINVAGTITETGTGNPQLILSGSSQQSVRIQSLQGSVVLDVNNSNGISLSAPLLISHILRLSSGKVKTTGTELLTIADNAVIEGASFEKFVDGPLGKIGDEAFLFPVGKGLQFASASLSAGTDVADEYICEYHQGNPMVIFGDSFETPGLTHMSSLEWWTIERRSGNTARQVSLLVTTYSDATLLEHLRVLRFDGQEWKNEGNISYSGLSFGTITSQPVSAFNNGSPTAFTLGSSSAFSNPLPVFLVDFDARRMSSGKILLNWRLADYPEISTKFFIEYDEGQGFRQIGYLESSPGRKEYEYIIAFANTGGENIRYRLRMENDESGIYYSETIIIKEDTVRELCYDFQTKILTVNSSINQQADLVIVDMQGRRVMQKQLSLQKGRNIFYMRDLLFSKGVFMMIMNTREGKVHKYKMIN